MVLQYGKMYLKGKMLLRSRRNKHLLDEKEHNWNTSSHDK